MTPQQQWQLIDATLNAHCHAHTHTLFLLEHHWRNPFGGGTDVTSRQGQLPLPAGVLRSNVSDQIELESTKLNLAEAQSFRVMHHGSQFNAFECRRDSVQESIHLSRLPLFWKQLPLFWSPIVKLLSKHFCVRPVATERVLQPLQGGSLQMAFHVSPTVKIPL